jgi:hypothetical protein
MAGALAWRGRSREERSGVVARDATLGSRCCVFSRRRVAAARSGAVLVSLGRLARGVRPERLAPDRWDGEGAVLPPLRGEGSGAEPAPPVAGRGGRGTEAAREDVRAVVLRAHVVQTADAGAITDARRREGGIRACHRVMSRCRSDCAARAGEGAVLPPLRGEGSGAEPVPPAVGVEARHRSRAGRCEGGRRGRHRGRMWCTRLAPVPSPMRDDARAGYARATG